MIIKKTFTDWNAPENYRRQTIIVMNESFEGSITGNPNVERLANGSVKIIWHTDDEFGITNTLIEVVIEREDFEELKKLEAIGAI